MLSEVAMRWRLRAASARVSSVIVFSAAAMSSVCVVYARVVSDDFDHYTR